MVAISAGDEFLQSRLKKAREAVQERFPKSYFRAGHAYRWDFPPMEMFVAHRSPRFIHERGEEVYVGFDAFVLYVLRIKPKFFIYGHRTSTKRPE